MKWRSTVEEYCMLFLDDYGNVVRQWRVESDRSENNCDGAWFEGCYKEAFNGGMGGSVEENWAS
jgi:hypothetical protein